MSQFCNPHSQNAANKIFWSIWEKFEIHHGDKDSYTDFLRSKQTVSLRYSQVVENFALTQRENAIQIPENVDKEIQDKIVDE